MAPERARVRSPQNTMVRFARDEIYTFVGSVLLAVNPYKLIPRLYGQAPMKARGRPQPRRQADPLSQPPKPGCGTHPAAWQAAATTGTAVS